MSGGQVDSSCTRGVMRTGSLPTWFPHCASTSLVTVMTDRLTDRQKNSTDRTIYLGDVMTHPSVKTASS